MFKILAIGDTYGEPGRKAIELFVNNMKRSGEVDFVVCYAENAADGSGITEKIARELFQAGCDVLTCGDHTFDKRKDIEMKSLWPMLVQGADSISAARPGARRESLENYLKRVTKLEEIADKHPGVDKSFVIQGGREVRVVVKPDRVPEDCLPALAREISKKIEENLDYPGQIKVVIIRESRVEDFAK